MSDVGWTPGITMRGYNPLRSFPPPQSHFQYVLELLLIVGGLFNLFNR